MKLRMTGFEFLVIFVIRLRPCEGDNAEGVGPAIEYEDCLGISHIFDESPNIL